MIWLYLRTTLVACLEVLRRRTKTFLLQEGVRLFVCCSLSLHRYVWIDPLDERRGRKEVHGTLLSPLFIDLKPFHVSSTLLLSLRFLSLSAFGRM